MSSKRTLNFNWSGLTQDTTILLTLNTLVKTQLTSEQNYVAWRVIEARAPSGSAAVIFPGRGGFGQSELVNGKFIRDSTSIEVPLGYSTNLTVDGFDAPVHNPQIGQLIGAKNATGRRQSMSVGTLIDDYGGLNYSPTFFWGAVGDKITIEADFQPNLMICVGKDYMENQFITADLTSDVLWEQDLASLAHVTNFDLVEGPQGVFKIKAEKL